MTPVLKLIEALRESDEYIKYIYMEGGCYNFYLFLKKIFPGTIPYISKEKTHIITRIGRTFYDINGQHKKHSSYTKMNKNDVLLAEKWSFAKNNLLKIAECPFCEEPLCIKPDGHVYK